MNGKILAIFFILALIIAGPGLYYLQVYHYYREVPAADAPQSLSAPGVDRQAVSLPVRDYKGIYSVSTPIGHRACFTTDAATAQTVAPIRRRRRLVRPVGSIASITARSPRISRQAAPPPISSRKTSRPRSTP
ncbi:hypothetical protein QWZ10_01190 [Paracoccus cavernae]|uniref:DUF1254 domain-containing protein n=1 Tax=Paracoccus cavernae TaxID=1571207 RepID=A0ABT8D2N0_9RHOB|nr:hypothetical protein [Paracoccus cavernae]